MPAVQELLINAFVTAAAVSGGELSGDEEPVVIFLFLTSRRLMAVETVHSLAGMRTHLVFVDYRILCASVALGAFAGGSNQVCARLLGLNPWPGPIEQEGSKNQGKSDDDGEEYGAERHDDASCAQATNLDVPRLQSEFYDKQCVVTRDLENRDGKLMWVVQIPDHDDGTQANGNQQDSQDQSDPEEDALEAIHLPE